MNKNKYITQVIEKYEFENIKDETTQLKLLFNIKNEINLNNFTNLKKIIIMMNKCIRHNGRILRICSEQNNILNILSKSILNN